MNTELPPTTPTHGETVKAGMAAKARTGAPTGPVPLGYRKVRWDGIVLVEINVETAPLVQEAFRLAALKRQSLRKILADLGERGLVSRHGKALSATALWRILTNPFYIAVVTYDGERTEGTHPSLIDRQVFERVQQNLQLRQRR